MSPVIFDYKLQLRKNEIRNPSLSNFEKGIYDKIGINFKTNQPIYKLRKEKQ